MRGRHCDVCGSPPPSDPHHVKTRGSGGKDDANLVSLCRECHARVHTWGRRTFEKRMLTNLDRVTRQAWEEFNDEFND